QTNLIAPRSSEIFDADVMKGKMLRQSFSLMMTLSQTDNGAHTGFLEKLDFFAEPFGIQSQTDLIPIEFNSFKDFSSIDQATRDFFEPARIAQSRESIR